MRRFYILFPFVLFLCTSLGAQCPVTVDAGEDIFLCAPPTPTQLNGSIDGDYLNFVWSPTTGMSGANTLNPTVTVNTMATYYLTARAADFSNNLIINGDFESGNAVFTSEYVYSPGDLWPEGVYDVLANPQDDHPNFSPCPDHTSGSGNMMAVNGSATANLNVWCTTVSVTPNTQYVFSAWLATLVPSSPARLQFSINGGVIGPIFNAPGATCIWQNYFQTWNSGSNTSATICIVNQNTAPSGNDFALDDIVFAPVCEVKDSVKVQVVNVAAVATPPVSILPCAGSTLTLSGAGSSTGPNISYYWDTPNGNIVSGQTTLNPVIDAAGEYTLTVTFNNGSVECTKTATVNVIESPNPLAAWITPPQPLGCGSASVFIFGNSSQPGFSTYQWTAGPGGNILTGQGTPTITVNQPGEYTLLVTNTATGCTAETTVTVLAATNPPTAVANVSGPITCQQSQANLLGAGSSTGNNITYAWNALVGGNIVLGQNTQNAVVNGPGTYVLMVTNTTNGCTAVDTAIVYSTATPPEIDIDSAGVFNCTVDTLMLSAVLSPAGATPVWTAGGGGAIVAGDSTLTPLISGAGTYLLQATDPATGCTATDTIVVSADLTPPVAVVSPADTITCQQPAINLSGAGSSTGPGIVYQWTALPGGNIVSGDGTLSPTVNAAATYVLLVTNTANTCTATSTVAVAADANAIVAVANAPDTLNCAVATIVLNTNGSSPTPGLLFAWTTTNGTIISGADSPTPVVGAPGTYQLLLTNPANGCTASDIAVAVQNLSAPNLQITPPDTLTCAQPQLTLNGQNSAPPGSFSYVWTASNGGNILSGDTTLTPAINAAGNYTLVATNLNTGCTASASTAVAIEAGTPVAIASVAGPITCTNATQTLNTSGSSTGTNFVYAWSGTGHLVSTPDTPSPVVDAAGTYALTITNASNGCTSTATVVVTDNLNAPPADAGPDGLLTCTNPAFSLSANSGSTANGLLYHWQTTNGAIHGNPDSAAITITSPGTYLLTVQDPQNGCISTDSAVVSANQAVPAVAIAAPALLTCVQTTSTLNTSGAQPAFLYQWQTADGQFVSGQNGPAPLVDAPGTYSLLVTDTVNGCTSSNTVMVLQDIAHPLAVAGPSPTLTCVVQQTVLQGQADTGAGFDLQWTAGNGGHIVSGGNSPTPTVDQPGDYLLTVSNTANGCTSTAQVTVLQDIAQPVANAGPDDTLSCTLTNLSLTGTGSVKGAPAYAWTAGPGGNIVSGANTLTPLIDAPGLYTLIITDLNNGCTASDAVQIASDATSPNATVAVPGPLTCTTSQLTLQGFGSLGANYTHNWTTTGGNIVGGANTLNPVINAPGTYTLKVTNITNGCTATATATVNQNITPPAVSIAPAGTITCTTTAVTLSGAPAGPGFGYFWTTANGFIVSGGSTATPSVNTAGTYVLTVTSQNNGCTSSASVQVQVNTTPPVIAATAPQVLNCTLLQTTVNGAVSQPANNFSASWTSANGHFVSGQNTLNPAVDAPGTYVLTVQNQQNGCTATASATVTQNIVPPAAIAAQPLTLTCTQTQISLDGTASTGQGTLSFVWSGGQIIAGANTATPTISKPGLYTLAVTDAANGCTGTTTVTALQNITPPLAAIALPPERTCILDTITLDAGASSSGANFSLSWSTANGHFAGGQNTLAPLADAAGTYTLLITDQQNGCTATAITTVTDNTTPPQAEAGPGVTLHCNNLQAGLQGSSATSGALQFAWITSNGHIVSGANTPNPVVDAAGTYLLTVTNPTNGCTAADNALVEAVPLPAFTPLPEQPDCHRPRGTISIDTPTGGTAPFSYSFNNGQSFGSSPVSGLLNPGTYTLLVQDINGCTSSATATLFPPAYPSVTFTETYLIHQGDSVQLKPVTTPPAVALADWQWSPPTGLSCDDCPEPWAKPLRPTEYTLVITDLNGCTAQNRVLLRVDRDRQLYAPNIFSPDGDGVNDWFALFGRGITEVQALRIFDRWGNQLFENEHIQPNVESEGWNGTFREKAMNPGVYVWQAVIEFVDGEIEIFAGDVTIYR